MHKAWQIVLLVVKNVGKNKHEKINKMTKSMKTKSSNWNYQRYVGGFENCHTAFIWSPNITTSPPWGVGEVLGCDLVTSCTSYASLSWLARGTTQKEKRKRKRKTYLSILDLGLVATYSYQRLRHHKLCNQKLISQKSNVCKEVLQVNLERMASFLTKRTHSNSIFDGMTSPICSSNGLYSSLKICLLASVMTSITAFVISTSCHYASPNI